MPRGVGTPVGTSSSETAYGVSRPYTRFLVLLLALVMFAHSHAYDSQFACVKQTQTSEIFLLTYLRNAMNLRHVSIRVSFRERAVHS